MTDAARAFHYYRTHVSKPVLVVEDHEELRETLRVLLADEGFEVVTAENGRIALDRLEEIAHPCVVLLDLMMPVMDGLTFLKAAREAHPDLKVALLTAAPPNHDVGADFTLKKPFRLPEVLRIVSDLCTKPAEAKN